MAGRKSYRVIVDWKDGEVEDSDELIVYSDSAANARRSAYVVWTEANRAAWPHCRIIRAWILTDRVLSDIA